MKRLESERDGRPALLVPSLAASPSLDSRENREFASKIKFVVTPQVAGQVREWARARLSADPNAGGAGDGYSITSLYFDTPQFDVLNRNGSYGRGKLRIRRYGEGVVVFLERKLRTRGLLVKRRTIAPLSGLRRLATGVAERDWTGYWFHRRLLARRLKPVCQISYRRTARVAMTARGPIRLTLDENLRALPVAGCEFSGAGGRQFSPEHLILELKFRCEMPAVFKWLVEEFMLNPQPVSKYRLAMGALGWVAPSASPRAGNRIPQYA